MSRDVETLRGVLLELEKSQRSPPEAFFVYFDELAGALGKSSDEIEEALETLAELDFIEGPGAYDGPGVGDNVWLFRKLTRRGVQLANSIRNARDWRRVKDAYEPLFGR